MDVMARLDSMEKELHTEKLRHKEDVARLNKKIDHLTHENHILKEENARLKASSIMTVPTPPCRHLPIKQAPGL